MRKFHGSLVWQILLLALVTMLMGGCATCQKPAAIAVEGITKTATVVDVDKDRRTVTLKSESGETQTYILSDAVKNFDQIKVGDVVRATALESVAIYARKPSDQPNVAETKSVSLAPKGEKPGIIISDTVEVSATVEAIDLDKRTLTIREANGRLRTIVVDQRVKNFKNMKPGDEVVLNVTKAFVLGTDKPEEPLAPKEDK